MEKKNEKKLYKLREGERERERGGITENNNVKHFSST